MTEMTATGTGETGGAPCGAEASGQLTLCRNLGLVVLVFLQKASSHSLVCTHGYFKVNAGRQD